MSDSDAYDPEARIRMYEIRPCEAGCMKQNMTFLRPRTHLITPSLCAVIPVAAAERDQALALTASAAP